MIPARWLEAPTPTEDEFLRGYALRAVEGRGALTEAGDRGALAASRGGKARCTTTSTRSSPRGGSREVEVDDGGPPFFVLPDAELDGAPAAPVLLCPFDNLSGTGRSCERLFGFEHLIEVYKREHERVYGYYVLPLLVGDRFLGRADLKADRAEGVLRISRFTPEPKARGTSTRSSSRRRRGSPASSASSGWSEPLKPREVSVEEARRIAVHSQLLDGSATEC